MDAGLLETDSTRRFSNRVEDYVRYRPEYPREIVDVLRDDCGLTPESVVVDVGSGTGLLTQLFLENGNVVYGIEPNAAMREAGEQFLEKYHHFSSGGNGRSDDSAGRERRPCGCGAGVSLVRSKSSAGGICASAGAGWLGGHHLEQTQERCDGVAARL
jgi:SAM-dependent methyltransferase